MDGSNGRRSPRLAAARRRLERWRKRYGGRGRWIPEELWEEAVEIARSEGMYSTARALRLDCRRLESRVRVAAEASPSDGDAAPEFVELDPSQVCTGGRTVLSFVSRGGDQLRIEIPGTVDVVGVAQAFWKRG